MTIAIHYGALYSSNTCTERQNWADLVFLYPTSGIWLVPRHYLVIFPYLVMMVLVVSNKNHSYNHYSVAFFTDFIQALCAYPAKGKVSISKMAEHSCSNTPTFAMRLLFLNCAYLCLLLPCPYFSKLCPCAYLSHVPPFSKLYLFVPTFAMFLLSLNCAYLCLLFTMCLLFLYCAYFCLLLLFAYFF